MPYSFMAIQKIKTLGNLTAKYRHNLRVADVDNAITELRDRNEELVPLKMVSHKQQTYTEAFKERLSSLPYYEDHKLRKNGVLAYEIMLTFSREADLDIDEWKRESVQWLHDTFDVAPDGKSNVLHAIFHADETGNAHIHAIVTPVDENGRLNARRFTNGSRAMTKLQSSYAEAVEDLGLERGLIGSSARHKDIRRFYAELNNALKVPEPEKNETAEQFRQRVLDNLKDLQAAAMRRIAETERARRRKFDKYTKEQREAIKLEYEKSVEMAKSELSEVEQKRIESIDELTTYQSMLTDLAAQLQGAREELASIADVKDKAQMYEAIQRGLSYYEVNDPSYAEELKAALDDMLDAGEDDRNRDIGPGL